MPNIDFDVDGVCNYCHQVDKLKAQYGTGAAKGNDLLDAIFVDIKRTGRGKKYDCVIGVSGGTDSSYLLSLAVERGLRPLAAHYDNT
ncbi:MAG: LPS biosynthesis protein, partial [Rubrivivax sp.]|nr:LPS biosynthesis protein [Rubrivivax sp.]